MANENFNEDLEALIEAAELDEEQEKKLEREFAREYHLITRDDRLEKVAEDLVEHFMGRKHSGKGMVICIDKTTAVKMYDKVQKYWKAHLGGLKGQLAAMPDFAQPASASMATATKAKAGASTRANRNRDAARLLCWRYSGDLRDATCAPNPTASPADLAM